MTVVKNKRANETCPKNIFSLGETDPYEYYEKLRKAGPIVWDDDAKVWVVLDYALAVSIFMNERLFGNIYSTADPVLIEIKGGEKNISMSQGDEHVRLRKLLRSLLSAPAVKSYMDGHIRPIINFVLDGIVDDGRADLLADVSAQIIPRVICSLLGMPFDDNTKIQRILYLNNEIVNFIGSNYAPGEAQERALVASHELNEMLLPYVRARRKNPKDDLISRIWLEAPTEYGELSEGDVVAICRELYFAGSDTTIHGTAHALYLLLTEDDLRKEVEENRKIALPNLIEEGLRMFAVVQMRHRLATEDTVLAGKKIKKGQRVVVVNAAANRDPSHYQCPVSVDLTRKPIVDHLTLGRGIRSCIGGALARAEMKEIISAILDKFPNVRLQAEADQPRFSGALFRTHGPLNVVWDTE